jgi:hypothetical protein
MLRSMKIITTDLPLLNTFNLTSYITFHHSRIIMILLDLKSLRVTFGLAHLHLMKPLNGVS